MEEDEGRAAAMPGAAATPRSAASPWAWVELAAALTIALGVLPEVLPVGRLLYALLFGWAMLRVRRVGWRGVGFTRPRSWGMAVGLGAAAGAGYQLASLYAIEPAIRALTKASPDLSGFHALTGDAGQLLLWLVVSWTVAAFGEELVYRGYLLERIGTMRGERRGGWLVALAVTSVLFGLAHGYQGLAGMISTTLTGAVFGALYLLTGRNLCASIVAHGVLDTIGFTMIYLGVYPGL